MRLFASALLLSAVVPAFAAAQTAPAPAAAKATVYTTEDTEVGTLLDDPAAKAVLTKYLPELVASDQVNMARSMTLKSMQSYAPDMLTDKKLSDIDVALAKLPPKK